MLKYKAIKIFWIFLFAAGILSAQVEICDNGVDDDNDNLVDLNDPDCDCPAVVPISMIPNPSFEEMDCCPEFDSELDCATDWIQASEATTDFAHYCDWFGWEVFSPPEPFPDGEGIMGFRAGILRPTGAYQANWKEYAGACLLRPLEQGVKYRFEFDLGFVNTVSSPPINISFFGTSDCVNLPFDHFGCPSSRPEWVKLADVFVEGESDSWVNSFIEITPDEDIYAIAIGPDCPLRPMVEAVSTYYYFDKLILAEEASFGLEIEPINHPCSSDFQMSAPELLNSTYQWYKYGVALLGEISNTLSVDYGEGTYQVRILDGDSCQVSKIYEYFIPIITSMPKVQICQSEGYEFGGSLLTASGFYEDTFLNQNNCDSLVSLELEVISEYFSTMEVAILAGETYQIEENEFSEPGEYSLLYSSLLGCDSLVLLNLTNFEVFIPTAFSPNFDGFNDYFQPYSERGKIASVKMDIYDRWGGLKYSGDRWDGAELNPGVYVYKMMLQFDYGGSKQYAGSVTLLR